MLAIAVELLTGRYVATAHHHRDGSEWPPHPARLFSALVATSADGEDADRDHERGVLLWLEGLPAPLIDASDADERAVVTHYVPINDTSVVKTSFQVGRYREYVERIDAVAAAIAAAGGDERHHQVERARARVAKTRDVGAQVTPVGRTPVDTAVELLPDRRGRQARTYPSVTAHDPVVVYRWPEANADDEPRRVLDGLLGRVARLGHSSSLVSCRLVIPPAAPARYVPSESGTQVLRHVGPGQLQALENAYDQHRGNGPRSLPHRAVRYVDTRDVAEPVTAPPSSWLSGELIVFERTSGARLPMTGSVAIASALRGALLSHAEEPIPEVLSGHRTVPEGDPARPLDRPHVAFLALPHVAAEHATGHLMGAAVLLPAAIDAGEREAVLRAIGLAESQHEDERTLELRLGRRGVVRVERLVGAPGPVALRRATWSRPAKTWISVTPVALGRHPGDLWGHRPAAVADAFERAAETIRRACGHVGLDAPVDVAVSLQPLLRGTRPARQHPPFVQGRGARRVRRALVHTRVTFAEPIAGPLVLGAGRYLGLGLMRPLSRAW